MNKAQAGSKGGRATVRKHGRGHMQTIGRRGAASTWRKYRLAPIGTNNFAMIDRRTGEVKAMHYKLEDKT